MEFIVGLSVAGTFLLIGVLALFDALLDLRNRESGRLDREARFIACAVAEIRRG